MNSKKPMEEKPKEELCWCGYPKSFHLTPTKKEMKNPPDGKYIHPFKPKQEQEGLNSSSDRVKSAGDNASECKTGSPASGADKRVGCPLQNLTEHKVVFCKGTEGTPAPQPSETSVLSEELAELEHEQWEVWSRSLISQLLDDISPFETVKIRDRVLAKHQRWLKLWKPYSELTEEEKEQDRIWARKVEARVLEKKNAEIDALKQMVISVLIDYGLSNIEAERIFDSEKDFELALKDVLEKRYQEGVRKGEVMAHPKNCKANYDWVLEQENAELKKKV